MFEGFAHKRIKTSGTEIALSKAATARRCSSFTAIRRIM